MDAVRGVTSVAGARIRRRYGRPRPGSPTGRRRQLTLVQTRGACSASSSMQCTCIPLNPTLPYLTLPSSTNRNGRRAPRAAPGLYKTTRGTFLRPLVAGVHHIIMICWVRISTRIRISIRTPHESNRFWRRGRSSNFVRRRHARERALTPLVGYFGRSAEAAG